MLYSPNPSASSSPFLTSPPFPFPFSSPSLGDSSLTRRSAIVISDTISPSHSIHLLFPIFLVASCIHFSRKLTSTPVTASFSRVLSCIRRPPTYLASTLFSIFDSSKLLPAIKGHTSTAFLDLEVGANEDKEGCTPLHWAALRGNLEACVVLLHSGTKEELMVKDSAGFTPAQIAADRGHRHVSLILSNAHRAQNNWWKDKPWIKRIMDIGYAPILFSLVFVRR